MDIEFTVDASLPDVEICQLRGGGFVNRKMCLQTNVVVPLEDGQSSHLRLHVVWFFLTFITYPVVLSSISSLHRMKIPFLTPDISICSFYSADVFIGVELSMNSMISRIVKTLVLAVSTCDSHPQLQLGIQYPESIV
ncbi:hypothetical protein Tco_0366351 [Tanacetum coccineum]